MNHSDDKFDVIVVALERISQAFKSMLWEYTKKQNLSPIQIQFLIYIATNSQESNCVSEISRKFSLTQATVSDAISTLVKKELVERAINSDDRRQKVISLSETGRKKVQTLLGWQTQLIKKVQKFPDDIKEVVARFLVELIESLHQDNILPEVSTCYSCVYFSHKKPNKQLIPWCVLRNSVFSELGYKIDCNNFIKKEN